ANQKGRRKPQGRRPRDRRSIHGLPALVEIGPNGTACPSGVNEIDLALSTGRKSGYRFTRRVSSFSGQAPETSFGWNADPVSPSTGQRHLFVDQTGIIRVSKTGQADENSETLR